MTQLNNCDARAHRAYDDSVRTAVRRAQENPGYCFSVYWDGSAIYVRASEAAPPLNSRLVCIARQWDGKTVQVSYPGAQSEFVKVLT